LMTNGFDDKRILANWFCVCFRFIGIEVLKKLYSLNLSHNSISRIENLVRSSSLVELNLSMNELEDISYMPSMMNLKILNLNNNKVYCASSQSALDRPKYSDIN
jgi:Leucine-rich repeat (LRR) protein